MIRWGCQSTNLIQFFNDNLIPLNMSLEGENCLIMKGLVFIEFENFFEAYSAKKLLNNLIFEVKIH